MKKRTTLLVAAMFLVGGGMFAEDRARAAKDQKKEAKPAASQQKAAMPEPTAEEKAMWDAMMKAATPGDMHKKLEPFVGNFDVQVMSWMAPGTDPIKSSGSSVNSWALGGRYVEQRFTGTFMNMPFNGLGYTGYDNVKKNFVGTWMDNMSTAVMMTTGQLDEDGMTFMFSGTMVDPMSGKDTPLQETIIVQDNDHHTLEMWGPAPDGKMFKMMEIHYARKQ